MPVLITLTYTHNSRYFIELQVISVRHRTGSTFGLPDSIQPLGFGPYCTQYMRVTQLTPSPCLQENKKTTFEEHGFYLDHVIFTVMSHEYYLAIKYIIIEPIMILSYYAKSLP